MADQKDMRKKGKITEGEISMTNNERDTKSKEGKPILVGKKRFTRPTTKLRLNAKATLNPALKSKEPKCIEPDSPEPLKKEKGSLHKRKK